MLKLLDTTQTFNNFRNTKCAEVYCQNEEMHFSIVCIYCDMKTFEFCDFLLHFKNVHLQKSFLDKPDIETAIHIKNEATTTQDDMCDAEELLEMAMSPTDIKFINDQYEVEVTERAMEVDWGAPEAAAKNGASHTKTGSLDFDTDDDGDWIAEDIDDGEDYTPKIIKKTPPTSAPKKHMCQECDKTYKKLRMLEHHVSKCHRNTSNATGKKSGDKEDMMEAAEPGAHKCGRCVCTFAQERALYAHQRKKHGGYPCLHCDKLYKNQDSLRTHAFLHLGVRSFVCDLEACGKAFFNKKHLLAHKRIVHSTERKFVCELCGWHSKQMGALTVHMRSHTGEKPYACKECGKSFASSSLLIEHKPIHSAERPHKCDVCGATFSRPKALYHHKFLHSDVKQFVCKICDKAYAQAAGLAGHMRQHRAELDTHLK